VEAALAQALVIGQDDPNIRFQRGMMYVSLGQDTAALADFSALIDSGKEGLNLRPVHTQRAAVYLRMGEFEKAAGDYESAWKQAPREADTNNNLAWLLATCPDEKLRDPARAVTLATKGVELAPQNWMYWNTLGIAQYVAGNWPAAIEALNKAEQLEPEKALAFNGFFLAMAHWQSDNKEEARKWFDEANAWMEKNQPDNQELKRFRADAAKLLAAKPQADK
jgi:tetratricopeptide (TPR) repeat protein